jgi:hypothetical protein
MKSYGEMEVWLYAFLTSVVNGDGKLGETPPSHPPNTLKESKNLLECCGNINGLIMLGMECQRLNSNKAFAASECSAIFFSNRLCEGGIGLRYRSCTRRTNIKIGKAIPVHSMKAYMGLNFVIPSDVVLY